MPAGGPRAMPTLALVRLRASVDACSRAPSRGWPARRRRRRAGLLRRLRREAGQAPVGREDASVREGHGADRGHAPRGAVHPSDPRRARRRALVDGGQLGPTTVSEAAELWVELIGAARRKGCGRTTSSSATRTWIADAEPVVRRACELAELRFEPAMLDYHAAAGDRMSAVARDFKIGGDGGPGVSRARAPARPGLRAAEARARRALAPGDGPGRCRGLRGDRRRDPRRARLRTRVLIPPPGIVRAKHGE